jgi:Niemann-Pick C1 protein
MGPAVFNGGFSTLLAILMLVNSKSYVFISFFKVSWYSVIHESSFLSQIFFLMIVIGLFHGLVVLPTALSIICPEPYSHYTKILETKPEHMNGIIVPANGIHKSIDKK